MPSHRTLLRSVSREQRSEGTDELSRTRVPFIKLGLERSGVRKPIAHSPAVVTDVSWPSFAESLVCNRGKDERIWIKLTHVWCDEHPLGQYVCV